MRKMHYTKEDVRGLNPSQKESLRKYLERHKVGTVGNSVVCFKWKILHDKNYYLCKLHSLDYTLDMDNIKDRSSDYLFKEYVERNKVKNWAMAKFELLEREHSKMISLGFKQINIGIYELNSNPHYIMVYRNNDRYLDEERLNFYFYEGMNILKKESYKMVSNASCDDFLRRFIKERFDWHEIMCLPSGIRDWFNIDSETVLGRKPA